MLSNRHVSHSPHSILLRRSRALSILLGVALVANTGLAAKLAQESKKLAAGKQTGKPAPTLLGISKEIDKLRKMADYQVLVRVKVKAGFEYFRGVHLGDGLIATPYIPSIAPGQSGSLSFASSNYRALALGSNKNFASYWQLRDSAHHAALPTPRFFAEKKSTELGPMVLIVTGKRARLSLLDAESFNIGLSDIGGRIGGSGKKVRQWSNVFAYYLEDRFSDVGSPVLAMDGSFVGLLLRPMRNIIGARKQAAQAKPQSPREQERQRERTRRLESFAMVLDGKLLRGRAAAMLKKLALADAPPPSIGVRFPFFGSSPSGQRARGAYGTSNILMAVCRGGPADRAGAKAGDIWTAVNGKVMTEPSHVRIALGVLKPGDVLVVRYDRADKKGLVLKIKPD